MILKKIMKTFKSTASKIKTLRFFFLNKSPNVTLNKPPPPLRASQEGARIRGFVYPGPPPLDIVAFWKPKT